jgi:MoaA/NifB/PqqE/SkfB family radical SAM enzyme
MREIELPKHFNYVAAFLTFACQLRCPYCINHHGGDLVKGRRMTGKEWIAGLNRLTLPPDLPVTLQGGEPSVHKDFYEIINGIKAELQIDLLTNLEFDVVEFAARVPPERMRRGALYANIRVSYHRGQSKLEEQLQKVAYLAKRGYSIGVWAVDHPEYHEETLEAQRKAWELGLDFRLKEFLGPWKGTEYGSMRYPNAVNSGSLRYCECRTSELLISPSGYIHRCHSDLYANRIPIGHIHDHESPLIGQDLPCAMYGRCNSCDIKVKTNRFQEGGHSSVQIRNVSEPYMPNAQIEQVMNTYGKVDAK